MIAQEKNADANVDARKLACLLKNTHGETLLNNFVGIALSSYMNGVNDTRRSLSAVNDIKSFSEHLRDFESARQASRRLYS